MDDVVEFFEFKKRGIDFVDAQHLLDFLKRVPLENDIFFLGLRIKSALTGASALGRAFVCSGVKLNTDFALVPGYSTSRGQARNHRSLLYVRREALSPWLFVIAEIGEMDRLAGAADSLGCRWGLSG